MRSIINIVESSNPEGLADKIEQWASGYDAEDVYSGKRLKDDREIIDMCAGLDHQVAGMLYRGQGISDTAARNLALGKPAKTKKMKTLLTSWSKSEQVAREFAEVALTNHGMSAAVIAVPASMLTVVVDFEQVDGAPTDEREVLCLHEVIPLNADTVIAYTLWDEDEHS